MSSDLKDLTVLIRLKKEQIRSLRSRRGVKVKCIYFDDESCYLAKVHVKRAENLLGWLLLNSGAQVISPEETREKICAHLKACLKLHKKPVEAVNENHLNRVTRGRRSKREWTPEMISKLGKIPDAVLTTEFDMSPTQIWLKRKELNIPPCERQKRWTVGHTRLLGWISDEEVAQMTDRREEDVRNKRLALKINSCPDPIEWTEEMHEKLGKTSDAMLAREFKCSEEAVTLRRNFYKIRIKPKEPKWTPEIVKLLGTVPDREIVRNYSIRALKVRQKREELGIPAFTDKKKKAVKKKKTPPKKKTAAPKKKKSPMRTLYKWTPEELELFKTMTDKEIAQELNLGLIRIGLKRAELRKNNFL